MRDTFVEDHLPPPEQWPEFINLAPLGYPERLNVASELLDGAMARGWGDRPCIRSDSVSWTYAELRAQVQRIANVLVDEHALKPGQRVLIRSANTPMMAALYLGVVLAGGVVVPTMPLLRARELAYVHDKARVQMAFCDQGLAEEIKGFDDVTYFGGDGAFEKRIAAASSDFTAADTRATDPCVISFTSGTTGNPKAAVHLHRTMLASADSYPPAVIRTEPDDVFIGSPPLAFTFGTGCLLVFPLRAGASVYLVSAPTPPNLAAAIERERPTICVTSPTGYRMMAGTDHDLSSLRLCISAGEPLPKATFETWLERTGIPIMDGIGSTELFHIFLSASPDEFLAGSTGKPVPGYEVRVVDDSGKRVVGELGRLSVRGPTGCLYLDDERQKTYVQGGWNFPGDAYIEDEDGWFWYQSRTDDLIISGGYNIAGPEVEDVLLGHPAVGECAVVGLPDADRGQVAAAFVVLREGFEGDDSLRHELQDHVKAQIAPYKYPRVIQFVDALPRTPTGKVQRYVLRQGA